MTKAFRSCLAGGVLIAFSVFSTSEGVAQEANIPGIIGGAIEGDIGGAAGAALGYDYYGRSGYYPGSRGGYGWSPYDPRQPYYHGGRPSPYRVPAYDRRYSTGYRGTPDVTVQMIPSRRNARPPVPTNPSPESGFYRAVIENPEDTRATLRFAVNGRPYELDPGENLEFSGRRDREIRFDRGKDNAVARYSLSEGRFVFAATDRGWELYRHPLESSAEEQGPNATFKRDAQAEVEGENEGNRRVKQPRSEQQESQQ